jgi:hypothetical protein
VFDTELRPLSYPGCLLSTCRNGGSEALGLTSFLGFDSSSVGSILMVVEDLERVLPNQRTVGEWVLTRGNRE